MLAYKADKTTFSIDDVTLTFYCGSQNAGEHGVCHYMNYPIFTYIYFAEAKTYAEKKIVKNEIMFDYAEGFTPEERYNILENDERFSVCKKTLSTDLDSFYKNNTVKRMHADVPPNENTYAAADKWGKGSALYKANRSDVTGVIIPDVSYTFTIPETFFTESEGYVFFCVSSYYSEDYKLLARESGELLEHRDITIYYTKNGSSVTLSSYYNKLV